MTAQRIAQLERRLKELAATVDLLLQGARNGSSPPVRIAKTVAEGGPYPTTGQTFHVEFLNGTFTLALNATPSYTKRVPQRVVCCNIVGTLPPVNKEILVYYWKQRWWTAWYG
jgi:hypothetical protein